MTLKNCNPFSAALCFFEIIIVSMFVPNPILTCISFVGAILYCAFITVQKDLGRSLLFCLVLFLLITAVNPLFSHNGVTVLYYMNDNPVTMEAYLYGAGIGLMVSSVFLWCKAFSLVMTADRVVYLFGKAAPKTALVISVAIRYIPMLKRQAKRIKEAQKTLAQRSSDSYYDRIKAALRTFSALVGWSLEKAVETAKSMRARGYGSKKHKTYSDITFRLRDILFITICICFLTVVFFAAMRRNLVFDFYPAITISELSVENIAAMILFAVLAFLPAILEIKECMKWKRLESKI